jgi:hypothetical protein
MEITDEVHRSLGAALNNEVWSLLRQPERTEDEDWRMIHAAHASLYHWLRGGDVVNEQRGAWLLARVYATVGQGENAMRHAIRCLVLTEENADEMKDFDFAFARESLARAYASLGEDEEAREARDEAKRLGAAIADEEDRALFEEDLRGGEWFGLA